MGELRVINQPNPKRCPICQNQPTQFIPDAFFPGYDCPRCGNFDYERKSGWQLPTSPAEMVLLSSWVREQNAVGLVPVRIMPETARRVMQGRLPGLRERANRVLAVLAREYPRPGLWFVVDREKNRSDLLGVSIYPEMQMILCY